MINACFLFIFLATPAEKCCQNKNVPEECIGFCTPSTAGPLSKNDLVKICNPFWDAIFQCRRIVEGMVEFSIANLRSIMFGNATNYHIWWLDGQCIFAGSNYYKAPNGENCPKNEIISSRDTCKEATRTLGLDFQVKQLSDIELPAGCYHSSITDVYFNNIIDSDQTDPKKFGKRGGICLRTGSISLHNHLQMGFY